jgi:hypothetical protein
MYSTDAWPRFMKKTTTHEYKKEAENKKKTLGSANNLKTKKNGKWPKKSL